MHWVRLQDRIDQVWIYSDLDLGPPRSGLLFVRSLAGRY